MAHGYLVEDLQAVAGDEQHPDEHGDEDRGERVVAGKKGDEDPGEAVAQEERLGQPSLGPGLMTKPPSPDKAPEKAPRSASPPDRDADRRRHARIGVHEAGVEAETADLSSQPARTAKTSAMGSARLTLSQPIRGRRSTSGTAPSSGTRLSDPSTRRRRDRAGS